MVAGLDLLLDRAVERRHRLVEQDGAVVGGPERQAGEAVLEGPASWRQTASWWSASTLTPRWPASRSSGQVLQVVATENDTSGGSRLTEVNELAAMPVSCAVDLRGHGDHPAGEGPERLRAAVRVEVGCTGRSAVMRRSFGSGGVERRATTGRAAASQSA